MFASGRKAVFPAPTATCVHRLRIMWSSLSEVICHKKFNSFFLYGNSLIISLIVLIKLGENPEIMRSATLDHAQIQQYRYQQKQKLWATLRITLSSSKLPNLILESNLPQYSFSLKLVFEAPGEALRSRSSAAYLPFRQRDYEMNLCAKFSKFLFS